MENLEVLRKKLEKIDFDILELLAKRFSIVEEIGELKKEVGTPVVDEHQEQKVLSSMTEKGEAYGLSKELVNSIWNALFQESYEKER